MSLKNKINKDHIGGVLLVVLGIAVLWAGMGYRMGTLNRMGAGFIPVVLGILMALVGAAIGLTAATPTGGLPGVATPPTGHGHGASGFEWRGWLCILGGVASFVVLGTYGGLVPATFAAVFISAMGDRENTYLSSGILAAVVTVFGVIVFYYGLSMQLPLFHWG